MIRSNSLTDKTQRVVVPVTLRGGRIVPFYGGEMPRLREGSVMELITEETAFLDRSELQRFNEEDIQEILPGRTELYAVIARRGQEFHALAEEFEVLPPPVGETVMIPFKLAEALRLRLRGTRNSDLMPCLCDLEIKGEKFPASVNQAYTRLSELYETWRRSHTGNVFTKVYFQVPETKVIRPLEDLRKEKEAEAEKKLFYKSGELLL